MLTYNTDKAPTSMKPYLVDCIFSVLWNLHAHTHTNLFTRLVQQTNKGNRKKRAVSGNTLASPCYGFTFSLILLLFNTDRQYCSSKPIKDAGFFLPWQP